MPSIQSALLLARKALCRVLGHRHRKVEVNYYHPHDGTMKVDIEKCQRCGHVV
jgi:hypothetical protein